MQKSRNVQYVAAGVQTMPGITMNVRSNVRLPDSEAGRSWAQERQPYYAAHIRPAEKRSMTVPMNAALIFLTALILLFGFLVISKACERSDISKRISAMESGIAQTERDNENLKIEIDQARDSARISYAASQNLGMIASTGVEAVRILAPETRPYEKQTAAQTAPSPNAVPGAYISGSR